jgi:hypothetical protein
MFRLASVAGRAVLVDDPVAVDLASLADDETLADPMAAIARHRELHDLQALVGPEHPAAGAGGPPPSSTLPFPGRRRCSPSG